MHTAPQNFAPIFALAEEAPSHGPASTPSSAEPRPCQGSGPAHTANGPQGDAAPGLGEANEPPAGKLRLRVPKVYIVQTAPPAKLGRHLS